jgi:cytoskeletal protein CcmA (bactofilin family)
MTIKMNSQEISSVLDARCSMLDTQCSIPDRKSKACPSTGRLTVERSRGIVNRKSPRARPGVALLIVLFIVMAITILSLGFVSRSDVELSCGQNMLLRTQMDYLAESGLEHARGLILNPQDVSDPTYPYWRGGTGFQLVSGSNDYYDVAVNREADLCNYTIDCDAYRLDGTERTGLSRLRAELRIDPCIAYWAGSNTAIWPAMTINGDVYCGGTLTNNGSINGDAFAIGAIIGPNIPTGRKNEYVAAGYPVAWPNLAVADFTTYTIVDGDVASIDGVGYSAGDANMPSGVTINGTLIVDGNLTVSGTGNVITAEPNLPALLVGGQVVMKDGSSLQINGLAQIEQQITVDPDTTATPRIDVTGGLFIHQGGISNGIAVNVIADPAKASVGVWPASGAPKRWSPAAGAFFRSITRPLVE